MDYKNEYLVIGDWSQSMFDLEPVYIFSYFSMKFYVTGTHQKCLTEALLTEYQQLIFHGGNIQNINTFWLKKKMPYL